MPKATEPSVPVAVLEAVADYFKILSETSRLQILQCFATKDYPVMVRTAAENGANLIITAAGLPLNLPEYTANHPEVALVPMVCGLEAVQMICQTWQEMF